MQGSDTGGGTLSRLNNGEAWQENWDSKAYSNASLILFEAEVGKAEKPWSQTVEAIFLFVGFVAWRKVLVLECCWRIKSIRQGCQKFVLTACTWVFWSFVRSGFWSEIRSLLLWQKTLGDWWPAAQLQEMWFADAKLISTPFTTCIKWNTSALCCISFWEKPRLWHEGYYIDGKHMFYGFDIKLHIPSQEWLCHVVA